MQCFIILKFFRELQYLRHKIHLGLFLSFGMSAFSWIITILITGIKKYILHTALYIIIESNIYQQLSCVFVSTIICAIQWIFKNNFHVLVHLFGEIILKSVFFCCPMMDYWNSWAHKKDKFSCFLTTKLNTNSQWNFCMFRAGSDADRYVHI